MKRGTVVQVSNGPNTKAADAKFAKLVLRQVHVHPTMAAAIAAGLTRDDFEAAEALKRVLPDLAVLEFDAAGADSMPGVARTEVDPTDVVEGDTVTLTGYGCLDLASKPDGRPSFGDTRVVGPSGAIAPASVGGLLKGAPVDLTDAAFFKNAAAGYFFNAEGAVLGSGGPLTCVGDSGGPVYRNGKVVGVNSFRFAIPDRKPDGTVGLLWGVGLMPRLTDAGGLKSATWLKGIIEESDRSIAAEPAAAPENPPPQEPPPAATSPESASHLGGGCATTGRGTRPASGAAFTAIMALLVGLFFRKRTTGKYRPSSGVPI